MSRAAQTDAAMPGLSEVPLISVVLPVRNEERFIASTIAQLQRQQYPRERVEILVCDGMSDDGTRGLVRRLAAEDPRIRLLENRGIRSSSGRNVGFRAARGEIALVVDGHVRIEGDRLLHDVARLFRESDAACLGRPQPLLALEPGGWAESIAIARASRLGHGTDSMIYSDYEGFAPAASMGAAYRTWVFERVGYVDEDFDACEDLEFNTRIDRAGLRCFTSPALGIGYFARESLGGLWRQLYRYGFGRFKYLLRHPRSFSVSQLVPAALVLGLLGLPLALWLWPALGRTGLALAALYLLLVLAESVRLALRSGRHHLLRLIAVFPTIHLALGIGFLASVIRGGRLPAPAGAVRGGESAS
jgi:GT2 family glycosyltransferase